MRSAESGGPDVYGAGEVGSGHDARTPMDNKANTHLCPSPFSQTGANGEPTTASSVYMIVVSGSIPGTMIPLTERGTVLGRSGDADFQIDDSTVSRRHARVTVDVDGV